MNIVTIPYGGRSHYLRPDTSYNKDRNDYFCPDTIKLLAAVPFIYVRVDRAAKAVSAKFASRYYSTFGYGVRLIAPELILPGSPETWWLANSLDLSTYLSNPVNLTQRSTVLEAVSGYTSSAPYLADPDTLLQKINSSFEAVSQYTSLKTGDYLTIDLLSDNTLLLEKGTADSFSLGEITIQFIW